MIQSNLNGFKGFETYRDELIQQAKELIKTSIASLLETRSIYGSIRLDLSPLDKKIQQQEYIVQTTNQFGLQERRALSEAESQVVQKEFFGLKDAILSSLWSFDCEYAGSATNLFSQTELEQAMSHITIPKVDISCTHCKGEVTSHTSGYEGLNYVPSNIQYGLNDSKSASVFVLPYICQKCRKEPVVFFVRKDYSSKNGCKLQIVGVSSFPSAHIAKYIPKEEQTHMSNALISNHGGMPLAGIFYLRVFIEQYLHRVTGLDGKFDCEALMEHYALPEGFPKDKLTSLKIVYHELSNSIHQPGSFEETQTQFEKSLQDIDIHFKALAMTEEVNLVSSQSS